MIKRKRKTTTDTFYYNSFYYNVYCRLYHRYHKDNTNKDTGQQQNNRAKISLTTCLIPNRIATTTLKETTVLLLSVTQQRQTSTT